MVWLKEMIYTIFFEKSTFGFFHITDCVPGQLVRSSPQDGSCACSVRQDVIQIGRLQVKVDKIKLDSVKDVQDQR